MSFVIGNRTAAASAVTEKNVSFVPDLEAPVHIVSGGMGIEALEAKTPESILSALGGLLFEEAEEIKITFGLTMADRIANSEKILAKLRGFDLVTSKVWTPLDPSQEHVMALDAVNPSRFSNGEAPGLPKSVRSMCICGSSVIGIYRVQYSYLQTHPNIDTESGMRFSIERDPNESEASFVERMHTLANVVALKYKEMYYDAPVDGYDEVPAMLLAGSFSYIEWPKSVVDFKAGVPSFSTVSIGDLTDHVDSLGERGIVARIVVHKLADLLDGFE